MTRNGSPRPSLRSIRGTWVLRLFRPTAPFVRMFDGNRDAQRRQSDLLVARARQLPQG